MSEAKPSGAAGTIRKEDPKMEVERFRKYQPNNEYAERRLLDHLSAMEEAGWTLTTLELKGEWFDEETGETYWEKVLVREWRTSKLLGVFDRNEFRELDYNKERWYDAEYCYE